MPSFTRLPSKSWRAQVRRHGHTLSRTFRRRAEAEEWALDQEARIDRGETPMRTSPVSRQTLGDLIELHFADSHELGRPIGRTKEATLIRIKDTIGAMRLSDLTRDSLVQFAKRRAKSGAGPATIGVDISFISAVLEHAGTVHGIRVPTDQVRLGRLALHRLGLIDKSNERKRRPTPEELDQIIKTAEANPRQIIPLGRIVRFAVATALRQDEITRALWEDLDAENAVLTIRKRKHPRNKATNDQTIPLVAATGYDALAIIREQAARYDRTTGFIFPYDARSVGTAFRRVCRDLAIPDLHFHDLRHEAISRLFEADWDIPQVAAVSGHKDWAMLQRYTHLRPSFIAARAEQLRRGRSE